MGINAKDMQENLNLELLSNRSVVLVLEDVAVPGLASLELENGLVGVLHGHLLDPGLDLLLDRELEHLTDVIRGADEGAGELDAVEDEGELLDLGQTVVGGSDLDEGAVEVEEGEVLVEGHVGAGGGAEDDVQRGPVLGEPVGVLGGGDEAGSAHLHGVLLLARAAGDADDLVGTESLGPHDTEVAETTKTDDADALAGADIVELEGSVGGDTSAKHGGGERRGDLIGDLDGEEGRDTLVGSVAAIGLAAVEVDTVVGADVTDAAVVVLAVGADLALRVGTVAAAVTLSTDTNAVADLDATLDLGTGTDDGTDNLVTDAAGVLGRALCVLLV